MRVHAFIVAVGKQWLLHDLSVFVALGVQHAIRMRHIFMSRLPRSTMLSTFSHKRHDFRNKKLLKTKCVLILSTTLSETFLILLINERDMIKNVHIKYPVFLSILMKLDFSRPIFEESQISNFIKIRSVGPELFRADGQTWRSWQTLFAIANAPKNWLTCGWISQEMKSQVFCHVTACLLLCGARRHDG
jgi:hypothetical protein